MSGVVHFVGFDLSGRIQVLGRCQKSDLTQQRAKGITFIESTGSEDAVRQYALKGVITNRPRCPIRPTVAARTVTLTCAPPGARYQISGDATLEGVIDTDGEHAFTFGAAGTYEIMVDCFPTMDFKREFKLP